MHGSKTFFARRPRQIALSVAVVVLAALGVMSASAAEAPWQYQSSVDQMTGQTIRFARTLSANQKTSLIVREHPRSGVQVLLAIQDGQLVCGIKCEMAVRFDSGPPTTYEATDSQDGSTGIVFIQPAGRFLVAARTAHRVLIEATYYREGTRVLEFSVEGFAWPTTDVEKTWSAKQGAANALQRALDAQHRAFDRCDKLSGATHSDCVKQANACVSAGPSGKPDRNAEVRCLNQVGL